MARQREQYRQGGGWGYLYDADYKSERTLVHLLVDVVSKGGNLALDVGPTPSGANWAYTKGKDGTAYAIRLWKDGEERATALTMDEKVPVAAKKAVHLSSGREVAVRTEGDGRLTLVVPNDLKLDEYADAFRLCRPAPGM